MLFVFLALVAVHVSGATAHAQPLATDAQTGLPPSLRFAESDVTFFYALTNNRLKWDAVTSNAAVQRLMENPTVQRAIADARAAIADGIQRRIDDEESTPLLRSAFTFWASPEGRGYFPTLANLSSQELFVYADAEFGKQLAAYNAEMFAQISKLDLTAELEPDESETADDAWDEPWGEEFLSQLQVPRILAGAKLAEPADQQRLRELLMMLEEKFRNEMLMLSDEENAYFRDSLLHQNPGESDEKWVLHLKGSDYPWDAAIQRMQVDADAETAAEIEQRFSAIRDRVAGKSLVVSIGFSSGYLFASMGNDPEKVAPAAAEKPLFRRGVFKPLLENRGKVFSAVAYQNSLLKQQASWVNRSSAYIRLIPNLAKSVLSGTELEPESYQTLLADVEQDTELLLGDLNRLYNPAGDQLAFSFFFNGGIAGYDYHRHTDPISVEARPLESLKHVGENPAMFSAKADWEDDGTLNKWLNRIQQRAGQIMDLYAESSAAPSADGLVPAMTVGLAELLRATKDDLLPSLGNESAWVLDFQQRSQQWHPAMPPSEIALPLPAAGVVYGLADATQHRRAWRRYFDTINPFFMPFGAVIGLPPGQGLPLATETTIPGGVYLQVPGVEALGVDAAFSPGLAITDEWAVYTMFPAQAIDLVTPHTPEFPPPLSDGGRPLIAAGHIDFVQFADAAQLWLDYAVPLIRHSAVYRDQPQDDADTRKSPDIDETIELFTLGIDLLRQIPAYTHATYIQSNAVVTQSVIKIPTLRLPPAAPK